MIFQGNDEILQECKVTPSTSTQPVPTPKPQVSFEELLLEFTKQETQPGIRKPRRKICHGAEVVTQTEIKEFQQYQKIKIPTKRSSLKIHARRQTKKAKLSSDSEEESWHSDPSEDRISEFDDLDSDSEMLMEKEVTNESKSNSATKATTNQKK